MKEILQPLVKGTRALRRNRSYIRTSAEKSSRMYVAPVAILAAVVLILDGFSTWKSNVRS